MSEKRLRNPETDVRMSRRPDAVRHLSVHPFIHPLVRPRSLRPSIRPSVRLLVTVGPSVRWYAGPSVHRSVGPLVRRQSIRPPIQHPSIDQPIIPKHTCNRHVPNFAFYRQKNRALLSPIHTCNQCMLFFASTPSSPSVLAIDVSARDSDISVSRLGYFTLKPYAGRRVGTPRTVSPSTLKIAVMKFLRAN